MLHLAYPTALHKLRNTSIAKQLKKIHLCHLAARYIRHSSQIPNAKFVGTVRNPKDTFVSWYALAQAASKVMGGESGRESQRYSSAAQISSRTTEFKL